MCGVVVWIVCLCTAVLQLSQLLLVVLILLKLRPACARHVCADCSSTHLTDQASRRAACLPGNTVVLCKVHTDCVLVPPQISTADIPAAATYDEDESLLLLFAVPHTGRPLKLRIHASSVLVRTQPQLVVFLRCQQNEDGWYEMQGVTAVRPSWLTELAPAVYQQR